MLLVGVGCDEGAGGPAGGEEPGGGGAHQEGGGPEGHPGLHIHRHTGFSKLNHSLKNHLSTEQLCE